MTLVEWTVWALEVKRRFSKGLERRALEVKLNKSAVTDADLVGAVKRTLNDMEAEIVALFLSNIDIDDTYAHT
jgi:hypothetical protein